MNGNVLRQSLAEDRLGRGGYAKARKAARVVLAELHSTESTGAELYERDTFRIGTGVKSEVPDGLDTRDDFEFDAGEASEQF